MSMPSAAVVTTLVLIPARVISLPVGCGAAVIVCSAGALLPASLVAMRLTSYLRGSVKVCDGCCAVDVVPSPKSQAQLVGPPVEVSVKVTTKGAVPDVGVAVNRAVGAGAGDTVMVCGLDTVEPTAFDVVSVTM